MENFSDEKLEFLCDCQLAERKLPRPHQTKKYWIVSSAIHVTLWTLGIFILNHLNYVKLLQILSVQPSLMDSKEELIGTFSCEQIWQENFRLH
jgi:hypothetical protein